MMLQYFSFCLFFFAGFCSSSTNSGAKCIFETNICIGSTLEDVQIAFPNKLMQNDGSYQFKILNQNYSRSNNSEVVLDRIIYLEFDENNHLVKFRVRFYDLRDFVLTVPNFWDETTLAIGVDQLRHYGMRNLKWERPRQYEDSVIEPGGVKVVHSFYKSDIELVSIEVSGPQ